ncbi:MAG: oligosaccharide flippase family protein [Nanoarchaeota archaeon]|nr:oligosaccharide flippase family protein [Nanoarchaeota archaeon]
MLKKLIELRKNKIIMGGISLFIMINIFNFLNYVFHISMARFLGPEDYGILAVLMSLVYIFSIPNETIQTVISRYTSKYSSEKNLGEIKYLLSKSLKKGILIAIIIFLLYIPIAFILSEFLKINFVLTLLTGSMLFTVFTMPISRGILQGKKRFNELGINMVSESVIKLLLAVLFVLLGFKVFGAIGGVLIGSFSAFFLAFLPIKDILNSNSKKIDTSEIYSYGKPVFFAVISIALMYSLDVILARRFFPSELAGQYAVASIIGKMIFFATIGISKAMFPIASEKFETGDNSNKILKKSLSLISLLCLSAVFILAFMPKFIITILQFGEEYLPISGILIYTGIAFSLLSITNLIIIYGLRSHKIKSTYFFLAFVLIEILLLTIFNQTLKSFSIALVVSNIFMLIGGIIFMRRYSCIELKQN